MQQTDTSVRGRKSTEGVFELRLDKRIEDYRRYTMLGANQKLKINHR
jgi:hypothetical protein